MSSLFRQIIDACWPDGSAWRVAPDGDYDHLLDGIADNWQVVETFLASLAYTRDPLRTPFLEELEQEYGVFTNPSLTEEQRRMQLAAVVYSRNSNGSVDALQKALDDAGFDATVYENSPAVDPAIFLDEVFQMVAGGGNAYAGRPDAYAGRVGGELIVNGDIFTTKQLFTSVAGTMYALTAGAGEYNDIERTSIEYQIPEDPADWPFVFFVGGDVTRDGFGAITSIEKAIIPIEQRSEFKRIILKVKPIHSWGALIVSYE